MRRLCYPPLVSFRCLHHPIHQERYSPFSHSCLGSPDLLSEELIAYEAGIRGQPSDAFSWDLAVFFNDYQRLSVPVAGTPFFGPGALFIPTPLRNAMAGNTYGFELATTYKVTERWRLQSAYTFLIMDLRPVAGSSVDQETEGSSPAQHVLRPILVGPRPLLGTGYDRALCRQPPLFWGAQNTSLEMFAWPGAPGETSNCQWSEETYLTEISGSLATITCWVPGVPRSSRRSTASLLGGTSPCGGPA